MAAGVIVASVVLFGLTLLAVSAGMKFVEAMRQKRVAGMLRTAAGQPAAPAAILFDPEPSAERGLKRFLASLAFTRNAAVQIQQAGMDWTASGLLIAMATMVVPGLALGVKFPLLLNAPITAAVLGCACASAPYFYVRGKRKQRLARFEEQLPEALEFLSRSMRAGHALSISLEMLGEELEDPLGQEFRLLFNQHNLGASLETAMHGFAEPRASARRQFLYRSRAAPKTDRGQFERSPPKTGLRDPGALPLKGAGQGR